MKPIGFIIKLTSLLYLYGLVRNKWQIPYNIIIVLCQANLSFVDTM